ncbi:unnamed protein product [Camellia sinensis]
MGNLCCAGQPSRPKPQPKNLSSSVVHKHVSSIPVSSNVGFIEPSPSSYHHGEKEKEKNLKMVVKSSSLTLRECLMNSPGKMSSQRITVKKLPQKFIISSPELPVEFFTPKDGGLSAGKLGMIDEQDDEDDEESTVKNSSSMSGCRSGKLKKKVTFEETDIIINYSPGESFEE